MKVMLPAIDLPAAPRAEVDRGSRLSEVQGDGARFGDMLKQAVRKVNQIQMDANQAVVEMSTGENRNIHQTVIALEKANISFQLMLQVRNKAVEAYREVMRMQV